MHRILFVVSEMAPLIKTGGLADVAASLPAALARLGCDVRVLMPAYADALGNAGRLRSVAGYRPPPGQSGYRLLTPGETPAGTTIYLLEAPGFADRPGNPYHDESGADWPDNAVRFDSLARAATAIAADRAGLDWQPEVVHANDWQTGLIPVRMMLARAAVPCVFTVHNLHYQGLFGPQTMDTIGLPAWLWHAQALEFHNQLSFIKGGLSFAERLSTVSPTYAEEIQTPAFGYGLDGLLRHRARRLHGIVNGIDTEIWNPATDPHLPERYSAADLAGKAACKEALQRELGLTTDSGTPLVAVISRLVHQKGIDLILEGLDALISLPVQLAVLGRGEAALEALLREAAARHPAQVAVRLAFDEGLAHRLEAGADIFLMPSRFEPCGLNQMYSQRYGTLPVVHHCGGLADTVDDIDDKASAGTGFVFHEAGAEAMVAALTRASEHYRNPESWHAVQRRAMQRDFSWQRSAEAYRSLYARAAEDLTEDL